MAVLIQDRQKAADVDHGWVKKLVSTVLKELGCSEHEISILLTDDEGIRELNKKYLNRDRPTDVLAFSMREGLYAEITPDLLGDVVISVERARQQAEDEGISLEEEMALLLIHGILHLLGYNHEGPDEEARRMRQKEEELKKLVLDSLQDR